jgi:ATP-dependent DNA helicase MPH1
MSDFEDDDDIAWDDVDLSLLEATAKAGPSKAAITSRTLTKQPTYTQQTLYGKAAPVPARPPPAAKPPVEPKLPEVRVVKSWDRCTFQRTGWGAGGEGKTKKGKAKARPFDPEDEFYDSYTVDEDIDLAKLYDDPELDPDRPPPPMKLEHDSEAAKTFIYPLNKPKRDYQVR